MAQKSTINKTSAMAQLMAKHQDKIVTLKKGESIKGKITKLTNNDIIVDLGAKTEAMVLEKDRRIHRSIMAMFKVGDTVEVNVLNPESESGHPVVSLRRFMGDIAWKKLEELQKSKESIEATLTDIAKAGYMVATDFGISGFLPHSHTTFSQQNDVTPGQRIKVSVLELSRTDNKIIFSQKATLTEETFSAILKQFKVGQKTKVTITNITSFGLFVSLPFSQDKDKESVNVEGFIHISEIAWDKVNDLSGMFTVGQEIEAVVTRFDSETRRVNLSVKRLTDDPFEELMKAFPVDKKVSGTVTKVDENGVTLMLTDDVEGIIRKEKIPPTTTYTVGQTVTVTVSDHDKKRHKISLTPVLLEKPIGYR